MRWFIFPHPRPSRTNHTLPSQPGSALRLREVADCPEVVDSVNSRICPETPAYTDDRARGKRRGFSPAAAMRHSKPNAIHTDGCFKGLGVARVEIWP